MTKQLRDILADAKRELAVAGVGIAIATRMPGPVSTAATSATAIVAPVAHGVWKRRIGKPTRGHSISRMSLDLQLLENRTTRLFSRAQNVIFHERSESISLGYQSWGPRQPVPALAANGDGFELVSTLQAGRLEISARFVRPVDPNDSMLIAWTATLENDSNPDDVFLAMDSSVPPWTRRPKLDMAVTWDGSSRRESSRVSAERHQSYRAYFVDKAKPLERLLASDLTPTANGQGLRWSVTPRNGQYYRISA